MKTIKNKLDIKHENLTLNEFIDYLKKHNVEEITRVFNDVDSKTFLVWYR
jgi:hypothetical protein